MSVSINQQEIDDLCTTITEMKSKLRVISVESDNQVGQNTKVMQWIIKGHLFTAKEMMSDGDPFHTRVLKQLEAIERILKQQIENNNNY